MVRRPRPGDRDPGELTETSMRRFRVIAAVVTTGATLWGIGAAGAAEVARAPTQGALRIAGAEPSRPEWLPPIHTSVHARVVGFGAEVAVRQTFNNPFQRPLEAVYVFPLPHEAAVGRVHVEIGSGAGRRAVTGGVRPRDEAVALYRAARRAGRTGVLLEQERPNVFTQSVANIPPGGDIRVELVYQVPLRYDAGEYEFVYPMVVGPRYVPGTPRPGPPRGGGRAPDTDRVPDGSRITPPVRPPGSRSGHDVAIRVTLDAGLPMRKLYSPTHRIQVTPVSGSRTAVDVSLHPAERIPNKDLVVRYRLAGADPALAVVAERGGGGDDGYVSLLVEPPAPRPGASPPVELVFLVDTSRSMAGEPLALVKGALRHALRQLDPDDTFQIVGFSDTPAALSEAPAPADPRRVREALATVNALATGPDTELSRALAAVLDRPAPAGRLRLVCVMTDGLVGDERAVLAEVERRLRPDTRLFAFGVGSSVNRYLLDRLAELGRGAVHYALLAEPPDDQVRRLYERVRAPVMTDVAIDWGGLDVRDAVPARVPDLFAGHPVVVSARYARGGTARVTVRGRRDGKPVAVSVRVTLPRKPTAAASGPVVGRQWARARIRALAAASYQRPDPAADAEIVALALRHGLVSAHTAFVAVDDQGALAGVPLGTYQVPVELPEGMSHDAAVVDDAGQWIGDGADDDGEEGVRQELERGGDGGAPDDGAGDDGDEDGPEPGPPAMEAVSVQAYQLAHAGGWRWGVGAGAGLLLGGDAAAAVHLRLDRALTSRLAVGAQLALLSGGLDGELTAGGALLGLSYRPLRGPLELSAGAGPSIVNGEPGVGYALALDVRLAVIARALGVGLALRLDGARAGDAHLRAVTLGVSLTW